MRGAGWLWCTKREIRLTRCDCYDQLASLCDAFQRWNILAFDELAAEEFMRSNVKRSGLAPRPERSFCHCQNVNLVVIGQSSRFSKSAQAANRELATTTHARTYKITLHHSRSNAAR